MPSQSLTWFAGRAKLATMPSVAVRPRPRCIHRSGVTVAGVLRVPPAGADGDSPFSARSGRTVAVRLSRFTKSGRHIGLAVKMLGGHAGPDLDVLMMSAGQKPLGRRWFKSVGTPPSSTFFSSMIRYRWSGSPVLVGAEFIAPLPIGGDPFAAFGAASPEEPVAVQLYVATLLGDWRKAGTLTLTVPMAPDALRFTPVQCDSTFAPMGLTRFVRGPVYGWYQRSKLITPRRPTEC